MNTSKPSNKARLQLIISMSIFGTLAIFVRNISISSGELALYRAILAAILIGTYLLVSEQKSKNTSNNDGTKSNNPFRCTKKELILLLFSGKSAKGLFRSTQEKTPERTSCKRKCDIPSFPAFHSGNMVQVKSM